MISDLFSTTVLIGILASGIRLATPYLYAAIGETFSQRSGVLNLGVEGQMLLGAFAAFYVALTTGNLWLGVLAAMIVGALMGLAMAFVTVHQCAHNHCSEHAEDRKSTRLNSSHGYISYAVFCF